MNDRIGSMISEVASHSAWLDLANTPAQWQMGEAQIRKIVAGISTTTPMLHWTAEELAGFLGDVPRRRVGQWIDAALVMGTFEWRMATASPTWRSPCMVGAVRLTPSPSGGWTGTLVGNVVPNRALRLALLALAQSSRYPDHAEDDATPAAVAALGDLFAGDVDGKTEVAGRFVPTVLLCQLGPDVDALVAELLAASGLARALTRTQHFALRGAPPELLFPLDADVTQRNVVATVVRGESLCVDAMVGTGTTQTVANVIINLAAAGKTALLLSDNTHRVAAVLARLDSVGLGQCAMALSSETTGLDVATRLVTLLRSSWRPASGAQGDDQLLQRVEDYLQRHWDALLQPLAHGISLFEALCVASENGAPVVDIAGELEGLTASEMTKRRTAVARYVSAADAIADMGPVAQHPWSRSQLRAWEDSDSTLLQDGASALQRLSDATTNLNELLLVVDSLVPGFDLGSISALNRVAQMCEVAAVAPGLGADALVAARTLELEIPRNAMARAQQSFATPTTVAEYLELALLHRELQRSAELAFLPAIDTLDLQTLVENLHRAADGAAAMRYLRMRAPRAQVAVYARGALPDDDAELIRSVEVAYAARRAGQALGKSASNAARWFGTLFVDGTLDVAATLTALQWAGGLRKTFDACGILEGNRERLWRALVAQVATVAHSATGASPSLAPLAPVAALHTQLASWSAAAADVRRLFALDGETLSTERFMPTELTAQLTLWQASLAALPQWVDYRRAREAAHAAGLDALIFQYESQSLMADELLPTWERSVNEAALRSAFATSGALRDFDGATLERAVSDFARLDQSALAVAKARALGRLAELRPALKPQLSNRDVDGIDAEIADLVALVNDRNLAGLSVAAVLARFAGLWPLLMPCLILSPALVAAAVTPTTVVDTAIVLDAHRLPSVLAYPALARANAVAVFGMHVLAAEDSVWRSVSTAGLAGTTAAATVTLALRYHTQHASLLPIDARAGTVPAARSGNAVRWLANAEGTTAAEVGQVADYITSLHAQEPSWTYAVVVPTAAHRTALLHLTESWTVAVSVIDIRDHDVPAVDVVIACSGSWGTACDYVSAFSAVQWRHLLGSAARAQLVVVGADALSGVTPTPWQQVALDLRNQAQDVERGGLGKGGHILAQQLAVQLEARGWTVQLGVGDGDARIDLAVVDPNDASSFVLAVEFDSGDNQQDSVRSRARVWPQLVVQRSWRHVRVWALDWLRDANREAARVHGAVIAAIAAKRTTRRRPSVSQQPAPREIAAQVLAASVPSSAAIAVAVPLLSNVGAADTTRTELAVGSAPLRIPSEITVRTQSAIRIAIAPYAVAYVPSGRRSPNDLFSAKHVAELHKLIEQVLAAEAPMHISLLTRRVAAYFGVAKPTSEIAARIAEVGGDVFTACWEPNVVWRRDQKSHDLPAVRVAASNPQTKRDVGQVPLMEIAAAIRVVVERAPGLTAADLVRESAKLLGFARFTADVKARIERGLEVATFANAVAISAGRVALP